jgi:hypothetical protein
VRVHGLVRNDDEIGVPLATKGFGQGQTIRRVAGQDNDRIRCDGRFGVDQEYASEREPRSEGEENDRDRDQATQG